jgi:hypothetical protein
LARSHLVCAGIFIFAGALTLTGCGGGSSTAPRIVPTATPTPSSASQTSALPAAGGTLTLPSFGGYSPSYVVPSGAPAGTTTTATVTTTAPNSGVSPLALRSGASARTLANSSASALLFIQETFSETFNFSAFATWTIGLPAGISPSGLTLEIFDASTNALVAAASGSGSSSVATFQFYTPGAWSIVASHPYLIELVSGSNLNLSFQPNGNGSTFTYAGTFTQTFVRPPLTSLPTPNPNPTFSAVVAANVSIAVTVHNPAAATAPTTLPAGTVDFQSVETDQYTTNPMTLTTTSDAFVAYVASGNATNVEQLALTSSTSNGTTYQTLYPAGTGLIDVIPETAPTSLPANSAAVTTSETNTDGQSSVRTYAADGTYSEQDVYPGGLPGTAVANADLSASLSFPYANVTPNTTIAFGTPNGTQITSIITYSSYFGVAPRVRVYGDFYTSPALWSQTFANTGAATIPSSCGVPAALTARANELVQTSTIVDPVFGELETKTITEYNTQGLGTVCTVLSDTVQQYYDFTGQSGPDIYLGHLLPATPIPLQTTTTTETLALQSANVVGTMALARNAAGIGVVRAAAASFSALIERQRVERHAALVRSSLSPARSSR